MLYSRKLRSATLIVLGALSISAYAAEESLKKVAVPAGPLTSALKALAEQSGVEFFYSTDQLEGLKTEGVQGEYTAEKAVLKLLEGTNLKLTRHESGALVITVPKTAAAIESNYKLRLAQSNLPSPSRGGGSISKEGGASDDAAQSQKRIELEEVVVGIPEILVVGSKILNMDIPRTRDDVQPYVVFSRSEIEKSGASSLEEFFKQRLPMNTQAAVFSQTADVLGNTSRINLRGLGTDETLVLIDGRRAAGGSIASLSLQTDLNGIPLSAIERIEVLPTTASGIYGGSATGGVVNIVLRRDYTGAEASLAYDNTFDTDAATRRVSLNAGISLEDGKTTILMAGSYSDANFLSVRDRDFAQRGRAAILANNPSFFTSAATPPLGATTNIRSVSGAPLFGPGTPNFTSVPVGYAGGGGLDPLRANAGQYNLDLSDSSQAGGGRQGLVNAPTVESLMATVRRQFGPLVEAFIEVSAANNLGSFPTSRLAGTYTIQANAPNNPFGQAIRVTVPTAAADGVVQSSSRDRRIVGGLIVKLGQRWSAEADYTWNTVRNQYSSPANPATESAAISSGQLDVLRDTRSFPLNLAPYGELPNYTSPFDTTLKNATVRIAGPIGSLPGGNPMVSALIEQRVEDFDGGTQFVTPTPIFYPDRSQSAKSAYLEARLPLVSAQNARLGLRELEVQIAARHDDYKVKSATGLVLVGSTTPIVRSESKFASTNPTIGVRYRPIPSIMFRTSYGTGFLPPSAQQVLPFGVPANVAPGSAVDPRRGNAQTGALQEFQGGNPNLEPEESKSWSAGVVFEPSFASGLRLAVDYTRIDKEENIVTLPRQTLIDNESLFSDRITRAPAAPGDPFGVGPIITLDRTMLNIARAQVEAYDVQFDYRKETANVGVFDLFAIATWQATYDTQLVPTTPNVENVGIGSSNPLEFRANAGLTWSNRNWTVGWSTRYFDSYYVADRALASSAIAISNQGSNGVIPHQIYHDVFARYRFEPTTKSSSARSRLYAWSANLLAGTEIQLSFKNVLNSRPPIDMNNSTLFPYFYSPYGDPRLASYSISVRRAF